MQDNDDNKMPVVVTGVNIPFADLVGLFLGGGLALIVAGLMFSFLGALAAMGLAALGLAFWR